MHHQTALADASIFLASIELITGIQSIDAEEPLC